MAGPTMRRPVAADPLPSPGNAARTQRKRIAPAIAVTCLLLAAACTGQPPSPPQTSATSPPLSSAPAPSPTLSPTPTPTSARERALADSKQVYIDFWNAQERLYQAGGSDQLPGYLARHLFPGGPAYVAYEQGAKSFKAGGFSRNGSAILRDFRILDLTALDLEAPAAIWQVCVDQSAVTTTKGGKPFQNSPYIDEQATLHLDKAKREWQIYSISSRKISDRQGCRAAGHA